MEISFVKSQIVIPTLYQIGLCTDASVNLVTGTGLSESQFIYDRQIDGPALGWFQMEPATHDDCWVNFLAYRPELASKIRLVAGKQNPTADDLVTNRPYAAAMCRVKYLRSPLALPAADDPVALCLYWRGVYNTALGKGRVDSQHVKYFRQAIEA